MVCVRFRSAIVIIAKSKCQLAIFKLDLHQSVPSSISSLDHLDTHLCVLFKQKRISALTYTNLFGEVSKSGNDILTQILYLVQIISHGERQVHQVIQIDRKPLSSFE